jgi:hypothetical protein
MTVMDSHDVLLVLLRQTQTDTETCNAVVYDLPHH